MQVQKINNFTNTKFQSYNVQNKQVNLNTMSDSVSFGAKIKSDLFPKTRDLLDSVVKIYDNRLEQCKNDLKIWCDSFKGKVIPEFNSVNLTLKTRGNNGKTITFTKAIDNSSLLNVSDGLNNTTTIIINHDKVSVTTIRDISGSVDKVADSSFAKKIRINKEIQKYLKTLLSDDISKIDYK